MCCSASVSGAEEGAYGGSIVQIPQEHNAQLEDNSYKFWNQRSTSEEGSLSPLLFIVAMIPMRDNGSRVPTQEGGSRINHLMFMDDIKLFERGTARIVSGDIRMEFGIEKCALVNIQRGKVTRTEGIQLPDGINIKDIDGSGYKYLGIIEGEAIKHQEMKEKISKEYIKRLKAILKTQLWKWAVPVIRYSAGIVDWKNSELCNMDRKTRKVLNMHCTQDQTQ